eukprot:g10593.t1
MGRDLSSICRPVSVSGSVTLGHRLGGLRFCRVAHRYCLLVFIASLSPPSNSNRYSHVITLGSLKTLDSMVVANLTTSYVRVELRDNLNFPITTPAMESQIVMEVRTNGGSVEVNTDAVTIIDRGEPRTIQTKEKIPMPIL